MKRNSELLLVVAGILLVLSILADYKAQEYQSIREESLDYVILTNTYYIASHEFCDPNYICAFSNLSYPELQHQELIKYQRQADNLRPKVSYWEFLSKIFLILVLILHIIIIFMESNRPSGKDKDDRHPDKKTAKL